MQRISQTIAAIGLFAVTSVASAAEPLVDVDWVTANLDNSDIVLLDVRGGIAGKSKTDYLRAHIPGAVYTDYLKDGWRAKDTAGTPGMLAPTDKLEALIGGLGIGNESHVVIVPQEKSMRTPKNLSIHWKKGQSISVRKRSRLMYNKR